MSRVKIAEKNSFFCIFPEFFRFLSKNFSDFRPKNFKKFSKLPTCPEEKFVAWKFFLKFWIVLDFLQEPSAWFSNFYLRVQSKNCGKNSFFLFFFSIFFRILSEKFFRLSADKLQEVVKTTFCVSRGKVCDLVFFKLSNVSDFLQKHLAWFSNIYLRVQSKNCGKNSFSCFLSRIFSNFEQKLFRLLAKKLQKVFKTTYVSRGKVCDFFFLSFQTFRIFCRNIWHGSQNSIDVFRVKIAEKTVFFCFISRFFSNFEQKVFRLLAKKLQKVFKTTYVSRGKVCDFFFLSFQTFRIFCRNIWHGSQNSIDVFRVKIAEKTVFFCFISRIFSNFEQKLFRLLAKKLQKDFKTTYVSRGKVCDLKFFSKVLNRFGFSAETFGMVLKILSTCPE